MIDNKPAINNFAHKTSFRMDIPSGNKIRSFVLNVQETSLPGMTVEPANVSIGHQLKTNIMGTGVTFEPLEVRIILDEYFNSYSEIMEWMLSCVNYKDNKSARPSSLPPFIEIHVIDNAKKNIVCTFKYHEAFPTTMGAVDFSFMEDGNPSIQTNVMFHYKWFDIIKDGKTIHGYRNKDTGMSLHPSMM